MEDHKQQNYAVRMNEVTVNYTSSRWMDWWYGGLHYHIEHHVFPKMPRYMLRQVSADMKKLMKHYGVPYEHYPIWVLAKSIFKHLKGVANDYAKLKKGEKGILMRMDWGKMELK